MFFLIKSNFSGLSKSIDRKSNYYHEVYQKEGEDDSFLTETYDIKDISIKLDKGWKVLESSTSITWFKGYTTSCRIHDLIESGSVTPQNGNYLLIVYDKERDTINLHSDNLRGFNIFYTESYITNLYPTRWQVDYDELISLSQARDIVVYKNPVRTIFQESIQNNLTLLEAAHEIKALLNRNVKDFIQYNDFPKIEIQSSGGLDTSLLMAILSNNKVPYQVSDVTGKKSINWEKGKNKIMTHLSEFFWSFRQNNYYSEDQEVVVASGYWGDEFLMRNPLYVHWVLKHNGISLLDEVKKHPKSYMHNFIISDYTQKIKEFDLNFESNFELYKTLKQWCLRDYQVNHLNNTIMFTPFKDLEILELSFRFSNKVILSQVISGELQKEIIRSIDSKLLHNIDQSKNNR